MLITLILALAHVANAAQSLTINGQALDSVTLRIGQTCTVQVVSDNSNPYNAFVGFDDRVVLGVFDQPMVMTEAGDLAGITEYSKLFFYGYFVSAAGTSPPTSPGVHFTFEYRPNQVGETDLKLYSENFDPLIDSVHITIISGDMGTAFTYQGRLMKDDNPSEGLYDFQFKLYNDPNTATGNQIGTTIDIKDIEVNDGYFTVELDFGPYAFDSNARWLEITVVQNEGATPADFVTLTPRQEVTPTPYAIYAENAGPDNDWMVSDDDMYSIPSGYVGIGTTNPESKMHIEQSIGAWNEGIRLSYSDHEWDIVTDYQGERLTIAPDQDSTKGLVMRNGNTGLGTANPSSRLNITQESSAWVEGIRLTYGAYDWDIVSGGETLFIVPNQTITDGIVITNGKVGIGMGSPEVELVVEGDARISRDLLVQEDLTVDGSQRVGDDMLVEKGIYVNDSISVQDNVYVGGAYIGAFPRPAFDSGWREIAQGDFIVLTHNLGGNVDNYVVDMQFKKDNSGFGINNYGIGGDQGAEVSYFSGIYWFNLNTTSISVLREPENYAAEQVRIRIWVYN